MQCATNSGCSGKCQDHKPTDRDYTFHVHQGCFKRPTFQNEFLSYQFASQVVGDLLVNVTRQRVLSGIADVTNPLCTRTENAWGWMSIIFVSVGSNYEWIMNELWMNYEWIMNELRMKSIVKCVSKKGSWTSASGADPGILERRDRINLYETMSASRIAGYAHTREKLWCILGAQIWQMPGSHIGQEMLKYLIKCSCGCGQTWLFLQTKSK